MMKNEFCDEKKMMIPTTDETLPTGKRIVRRFDATGRVMVETHSYGTMKIQIVIKHVDGVPTDETYFVNRRLVSRKTYEKARINYADMPEANSSIVDGNAELLKMVSQERKERRKLEESRLPNPQEAKQIDDFCERIVQDGRFANAKTWIVDKRRNLGEMTHAQSKKLIDKILETGITEIVVCKINMYEDNQENSGHLVVTLPDDPSMRKRAFRYLGTIARRTGHETDFDNGQRFAFVKLD